MLKDRIKGVIYGQAIGDALGLGTEFMSKEEVKKCYPFGLSSYEQIEQDDHRVRWPKGAWTDDTEMMLCIAKVIIQEGNINLTSIARNFKDWFNGNPLGIGGNTFKVLACTDYVDYPQTIAEVIWNSSNKISAANGAVMRTSIIGLWKNNIEHHAAEVCKLTHFDPRCVGSCVIISQLINSLVYKNEQLTLEQIIAIGEKYDGRIKEYLEKAVQNDNIDDLIIDDSSMGYTLTTLYTAVWCLYHCNSFEEGLLAVVNAGGDADTNAAVACSLLGAKYGFASIPVQYVDGIIGKELLHDLSENISLIIIGVR